LPAKSRIWIYISPRILTGGQKAYILEKAKIFIDEWAAHGNKLEAGFEILHDVFLCIAADEAQMQASGCSIDKSVHFIQELGKELNLDFLNRTNTWYRDERGEMKCVSLNDFWAKRKAGIVGENTVVYNTLVRSVCELSEQLEVPFSRSWHQSMYS
jgi:hypothetical protein